MQTAIRNSLLAAGFLAVAIFYYWIIGLTAVNSHSEGLTSVV